MRYCRDDCFVSFWINFTDHGWSRVDIPIDDHMYVSLDANYFLIVNSAKFLIDRGV